MEPPTLVLGKQPFYLNSGGVVQLTTLMLRLVSKPILASDWPTRERHLLSINWKPVWSLTDPDTSDSNLLFVITQKPEHGWIISDGSRLENFGDTFSMDQLVHGKVAYLHGNGPGEIDSVGLNIAGQEQRFRTSKYTLMIISIYQRISSIIQFMI